MCTTVASPDPNSDSIGDAASPTADSGTLPQPAARSNRASKGIHSSVLTQAKMLPPENNAGNNLTF